MLLSVGVFTLLIGCSQQRRGDHTSWPLVNYEADSLTQLIEYEFLVRTPPDYIKPQIDRLRAWKGLENRADIFQTQLYRQSMLPDSSKMLLSKIRQRVDSAADPYLWSRLRLGEIRHVDNPFERFLVLTKTIAYYRKIGDSLMLANTLVDMANIMIDLRTYKHSLKVLTEGQQIYASIGLPEIHTRCNINRANVLSALGRDAESDSINRLLLNDDSLCPDTFTRELILRNLFISTNNMGYILADYDMMSRIPRARGILPLLRMLIARGYRSMGEADSAARYSRMAFISMSPRMRPETKINIYHDYTHTLEREGKTDSACMLFRRMLEIGDSLEAANNSAEIIRLDANNQIAQHEQMEQQRKRLERLRWVAGILVLVAVACIIAFLLYRLKLKEKYKKIEAELELEKSRRHIAATLIAMEEKDKLLNTMRSNLGNLDAADSTVREMKNLIRLHEAAREDRKIFADIFEKVSPTFVNNLREAYPQLPDKYVKLASYIYAGLPNHKIATAMMVRLESIHQQRWRLRNKMRLDPNTTLEDALHRLGKPAKS